MEFDPGAGETPGDTGIFGERVCRGSDHGPVCDIGAASAAYKWVRDDPQEYPGEIVADLRSVNPGGS